MNGCSGCATLALLCLIGILLGGPFGLIVAILLFIAISMASR